MNIQKNDVAELVSPEDQWTILRDVYKMLIDANVLNTPASASILEFKFPDELMVYIEWLIQKATKQR